MNTQIGENLRADAAARTWNRAALDTVQVYSRTIGDAKKNLG